MLTPFRVDTNSLFLTEQLNNLGLDVIGKSVVSDAPGLLDAALRLALSRADVVITTGGLGPTDDDLTRDRIAAVTGAAMQEDAEVLRAIEARFARRGRPMAAINRRQAQVPMGATPLDNPNGTAPGLWLPHGDAVIVALPGPPREMKPLWTAEVLPRLTARVGTQRLRRRVIAMTGRGESDIDAVAAPIYGTWKARAPAIATSILAHPGQVELHLVAQGENVAQLDTALEAAVHDVTSALGSIVFSTEGESLEVVVGNALHAAQATIAVAESCTGGLLLGRLTEVPGSSAWVVGGVVAYDNRVKIEQLGVSRETLQTDGAVSPAVASAMARGVRARLGATMGVGITGVAGPGGGSAEKPVGLVVIAVDGPGDRHVVRTSHFPGDRAMVRQFSVQRALDLVRRAVVGGDYND
jgi:nicotinamide-nucleotide amidase